MSGATTEDQNTRTDATTAGAGRSGAAARGSRRRTAGQRRWARAARVGLVTTMMTVTTVTAEMSASAATTVPTTTATRPKVTLTDWSQSRGGYGSDYGSSPYGSQSPWGSSSSDGSSDGTTGSTSGTTATVSSTAATKAQSAGVVLINTVLGYEDATAAGTGIVLTKSGEVVTNYHVVEGATSIKVTVVSTGKTYTAAVVGDSQTGDVALLKLKGASGLTTATLDDDGVSTGDKVTAVGNAEGTSKLTAAKGTVTTTSTSITTESEGSTAGESLKGLIATTADVVPGDSGGPLYDTQGEVVGIDTAASSGTEIDGYAIPIDHALAIVKQILSGHETSSVQIGAAAFLGVEVTSEDTSTSGSESSGGYSEDSPYGQQDTSWPDTTTTAGAAVAGVLAGSPAAKAGLVAGDTLTAIGGHTITSSATVSTLLDGYAVGQRVKVTWTDSLGTAHSTTVTLAASPTA